MSKWAGPHLYSIGHSMLSDEFERGLNKRGAQVEHIMSASKANPHRLTKFVRIEGERVWYPG